MRVGSRHASLVGPSHPRPCLASVSAVPQIFIDAAGPRLARSRAGLWRQVGLLAVAAALEGSTDARLGLSRALMALDHPEEAAGVAADADETAWGLWLGVAAVGQLGHIDRAREIAEMTRDGLPDTPDGREVVRRLEDLLGELATLSGTENSARFDLLGHETRPERRVLLVGRSSVSYIADPGKAGGGLVRFAPYEGASAGNRAHLSLGEIIEALGRGEVGAGRPVPPDEPRAIDPQQMLGSLAEQGRERTEELTRLAEEVRLERAELAKKGEELDEELARLIAERARLKRIPTMTPNGVASPQNGYVPKSASEAAQILGLGPAPSKVEVERAYRDLVRSTHPDRVAGLHPGIKQEAESLTIALNAARDVLLKGS